MEVTALVMETIALRRAYDCAHEWKPINEREEQCSKCGVAATQEGKARLQEMTDRFHGRTSTR